jgi:hypothetical protein
MRTEDLPSAGRSAPADLVLGRYRLERSLGTGGFATVWAAHDERLERDVAVKLIRRDRIVFERFEREARAAARLTHPAIVTLYEAAIDAHGAYLVSELVRGRSLDELLSVGRCSDRDILEISISIAGALAYAHSEGVIHRDVKPSNVLVPARRSGGGGVAAKLTDFGVARLIGDADSGRLTRPGEVIGTAAYMAPEQARGREASAAADLYSLALLTYEALTGVNPLRGTRRASATTRRPAVYLPPLRRQRRDLPEPLAGAIDRALRPRPADRGGIDELQGALADSLARVGVAPGVVAPRGWMSARSSGDESAQPSGAWDDGEPRAAGTQAGGTRDGRLLRALNAGGAALSTWWLTRHLLTTPPLAPIAAAALAALATLLAPRLGVLVSAGAVAGLAVAQGRPGGAMLLVAVVAITVAIMPLRRAVWGLPGGAVLLGTVSLAGAWPAIAARSGARLWLRAAVAGAGFIWLAAASALAGAPLYEHLWPQPPPPAAWISSPQLTVHGVLAALLDSGILGGAAVWALAAATGPLLVARRPLPVAAALAGGWAALTVCGTVLATRATAGTQSVGLPRGALAGALIGAAIIAFPAVPRRAHPARVPLEVP